MTDHHPRGRSFEEDAFEAERPRLIGIAYRMLGEVAAAEDIVQEAFLRWSKIDGASIDNPAAYLTTITTRLALDELSSARTRRERYVGPWLAEPVFLRPSGPDDDPEAHAALAESVTIGFLRLLDELSPVERAVFLLREVFDVPYADIAPTVARSEQAARQIASRARRTIEAHRSDDRRRASSERERQLVTEFASALAAADLPAVRRLLLDDAVTTSDGGGVRHAAVRPVHGADKVARFLVGIAKKAPPDVRVDIAAVNDEPAFLVWFGTSLEVVLLVGATAEGIHHLHAIRNPDKLGPVIAGYELPL